MRSGWKWTVPLLMAGLLIGPAGCGGRGESGGASDRGAKEAPASHGQQGQLEKAAGGTNMAHASGEQVRFAVHGMHCEGCVAAITKALQEREGVVANQVTLADSAAVVTYDPQKVNPADLKLLIEDLGYTVGETI